MNIPYQNFDLHLNRLIKSSLSINIDELMPKLVIKKQGGMCYEQSNLLYYMLK